MFEQRGHGDSDMDTTDYEILRILQADGRITMKALAGRISMSVPAAAERVRRLEEQGVIQGYRAEIDPAALGRRVEAVILAIDRPGLSVKLREFAADCPDITEAWDLAGRVNVLLRVSCRDMPAFQQLAASLQQLCTTESYLFLNEFKNTGVPIENE